MIVSSKYGIRIIDLYFDEQPPSVDAGLVRYHYWTEPIPESRVLPYLTTTLDLRGEPESLLAAMAKSTRYDIRRAERDGRLSFRAYTGESLPLAGFVKFFNAFADLKGTRRADEQALSRLAGHKVLALTCTCGTDGSELVWHAYMRVGTHARLLYSGSIHVHTTEGGQGQFLARANRYHHWRDTLLFRESGVLALDLGGVCEESCESPALRGIREFKIGFGGAVIRMFDCTRSTSAPARAALWLRDRLHRTSRPSGDADAQARSPCET